MNLQKNKSFEVTRTGFRWKTQEGEILFLYEMETSHIFNCMKMCFNHLAERWGGQPVWFIKKYSDYQINARENPKHLAWLVLFFIKEITLRGDLPSKYHSPFSDIIRQLMSKIEINQEIKMLETNRKDATTKDDDKERGIRDGDTVL